MNRLLLLEYWDNHYIIYDNATSNYCEADGNFQLCKHFTSEKKRIY